MEPVTWLMRFLFGECGPHSEPIECVDGQTHSTSAIVKTRAIQCRYRNWFDLRFRQNFSSYPGFSRTGVGLLPAHE